MTGEKLQVNKFYNDDNRKLVKLFPDNCLIVSDPPYNIGFDYPDYGDKMTDEEYILMFCLYKDLPCVFINYPEEMIKYICVAMGTPTKVVTWCYNSNMARQSRMIAWFNCAPDFSQVKQPYKNLNDKRVQELIKNGSEGTNLYDWWQIDTVKNVSKEKEKYTNQIPEEVISRIIKITKTRGGGKSIIIDPFSGSGTTCAVAEKLGFDWIGIDVSPKAIAISEQRILKNGTLFIK